MNDLNSSSIWAITAYFNPARYQRRLANYRVFHQHLGIPLLTVELGFEGRYELLAGDATTLIQLPGQDVLWQKERLASRWRFRGPSTFRRRGGPLRSGVAKERAAGLQSSMRCCSLHGDRFSPRLPVDDR